MQLLKKYNFKCTEELFRKEGNLQDVSIKDSQQTDSEVTSVFSAYKSEENPALYQKTYSELKKFVERVLWAFIKHISLEVMEQNVTPAINYNYFFHPNFCHVCKSEDQSKVKLCPHCHMISYCSEEHRLLHRHQHEEICQTIVYISKHRDIWGTRNMMMEEWVKLKKKNLQLLTNLLRRKLEPYEKQMFLFAKSCLICRQQDNLIVTCTSCQSVNKCVDHEFAHNAHMCQQLRQCLLHDFYSSITNEQEKRIPREFLCMDIKTVNDMRSFIHGGLHADCDRYSACVWSLEDYMYTDKFSGPLTLFHGMRDANLLDSMSVRKFFVVHIIAGSPLDFHSLSAWEVVLHEFDPGTTLLVVMIEPYLTEKCEIIQVCQACTRQGKKLQHDFHSLQYMTYVCLLHTRPDIVVVFNAEFGNDVTLIHTTQALQREACPILLTATSESKAQQIIMKMQQVLGLPFTPIINRRNRFASCRSHRDPENDSVYFPNQHLVIFRNLLAPTRNGY